MLTADRYIFRSLMGPLLFGVAAFVSILAASRPLLELTNLAFQGVPLFTLAWLFLLSLPPMVVLTLPMSMLLATLLGFGRLSTDSELVAMYAGGLSLYRAARPVLALAFVIMGLTILLNEAVVPWSIDAAKSLKTSLEQGAKEQRDFLLPQRKNGVLTAMIKASHFDPGSRIMNDVSAVFYEESRPVRVVYARAAKYQDEQNWLLFDAEMYELSPDHVAPLVRTREQSIRIQQNPAEFADASKKPTELSMKQLNRAIRRATLEGDSNLADEYRVAWWNRLAVPFASVVFAIIGLPLGLRSHRTSGGLGLGMSIVIIFLYWVVWNFSSKFGATQLPPFLASWLANLLGLGIGGLLVARAPK